MSFRDAQAREISLTNGGLPMPSTHAEVFDLAGKIARTKLVPACYQGKPEDTAVAMILAGEQGLSPVTALSFIAVINGRPGWHSDAVPGIAKAKGLITGYEEAFEGEPYQDSFHAVCKVFTPDGRSYTNTFSVADAKTAGLWGKTGPWKSYPRRMMQWRARSWAIRDAAPDAFFGPTAEELRDVNSHHRGPDRAIEINPETKPVEIKTMPAAKGDRFHGTDEDFEPMPDDDMRPPEEYEVWLGRDQIVIHTDIQDATKAMVAAMVKCPVEDRPAFLSSNPWACDLEPTTQQYLSKVSSGEIN